MVRGHPNGKNQPLPDFEVGLYTDIINQLTPPEKDLEDDPNEDDPIDIEELAQNIEVEMEIINTKRDRSEDETSEKNKKQKNKSNISSLTEASTPDQSDAEMEDTDDSNRTRRRLNSTPIPRSNQLDPNIPPVLSQTLQQKPTDNRFIEHYFSVPDRPKSNHQPSGRRKIQPIHESPENPEIPESNSQKTTGETSDWNQLTDIPSI